jgi:hypothetical protein
MKLKLADNLELPLEAVTQKFAFLGRTGSGKTYGAGKLAELFLDAGAQIVVLDGIGVWYGLRLKADGKSKGYSIPVFGGEQGDVPLEPQAGRLIAKLIVEEGFSAVLDVSNFRKHERKTFVTDFAEELYHRKKTNRSALHFFCEESQMFIPERSGKDGARMLGAFEDLIKLGRNYGIGASLISQRPQAVNKEVLNQTEILLAFQMTGPHERNAIKAWIADKGLDVDLADELPSLKIGDAYVWSPQFLGLVERVHIAEKKTYDASSTPTVGAAMIKPKELSPVDVEKIKGAMADVVKRAEESDPKKLQAKIRQLEADLRKKTATPVTAADAKDAVSKQQLREANTNVAQLSKHVEALRTALENAMKFIIEINARDFFAKAGEPLDEAKIQEAIKTAVQQAMKQFEAKVDQDRRSFAEFKKQGERVLRSMEKLLDKDEVAVTVNVRHNEPFTVEPTKPRPVATRPPVEPKEYGDLQLNKKQQEILDAVAWWESIGINSPSNIQVGAVALIDPTGGHFSNLTGPLSSYGLIERGGGTIRLTDAGRAVANVPETGNTLDEYHDVLRNRVRRMKQAGGRTVDILNTIIEAGGQPLSNAEIGERVGIDHTGGHFSNTIGPLSTAGLITRANGMVTPTNVLFPEGLS